MKAFRQAINHKRSMINWTDFEKIDIRVGTIADVDDFPNARKPAYKMLIDFGNELGLKKIFRADHDSLYKARIAESSGNCGGQLPSEKDS